MLQRGGGGAGRHTAPRSQSPPTPPPPAPPTPTPDTPKGAVAQRAQAVQVLAPVEQAPHAALAQLRHGERERALQLVRLHRRALGKADEVVGDEGAERAHHVLALHQHILARLLRHCEAAGEAAAGRGDVLKIRTFSSASDDDDDARRPHLDERLTAQLAIPLHLPPVLRQHLATLGTRRRRRRLLLVLMLRLCLVLRPRQLLRKGGLLEVALQRGVQLQRGVVDRVCVA